MIGGLWRKLDTFTLHPGSAQAVLDSTRLNASLSTVR